MNYGLGYLFLDDDDERRRLFLARYPAATCVKTVVECVALLKSRPWQTLFLDFDLDGPEKGDNLKSPTCGMAVVRWMVENKSQVEVVLHSHNAPMAAQMQMELTRVGIPSVLAPFGRGKLWTSK